MLSHLESKSAEHELDIDADNEVNAIFSDKPEVKPLPPLNTKFAKKLRKVLRSKKAVLNNEKEKNSIVLASELQAQKDLEKLAKDGVKLKTERSELAKVWKELMSKEAEVKSFEKISQDSKKLEVERTEIVKLWKELMHKEAELAEFEALKKAHAALIRKLETIQPEYRETTQALYEEMQINDENESVLESAVEGLEARNAEIEALQDELQGQFNARRALAVELTQAKIREADLITALHQEHAAHQQVRAEFNHLAGVFQNLNTALHQTLLQNQRLNTVIEGQQVELVQLDRVLANEQKRAGAEIAKRDARIAALKKLLAQREYDVTEAKELDSDLDSDVEHEVRVANLRVDTVDADPITLDDVPISVAVPSASLARNSLFHRINNCPSPVLVEKDQPALRKG